MFVDWDWAGAGASTQSTIPLDPGNSAIVGFASRQIACLGRFEETLELARRAVVLDPLNAVERGSLARICFVMSRQEEEEMGFKKALELNPDLPAYRSSLAVVYLAQGRAQDALAEMAREPFAVLRLQGYAVVYYALGRKKESDTALNELIAKYQRNDAFQISGVYAFRHGPDKAFEWLDRAYAQRDTGLAATKVEPLLKNL